jgi:anti-anti-sigma regulatory factor
VTDLQTLDRAIGLGPGDHASWAYDDMSELQSACVDYFSDGLRRSERLVYVGGRTRDAMVDDLAALPGRDALIDEGRLTVLSIAEHLEAGDHFDSSVELESRRQLALDSLDAGYSGLRVAGDITEFLVRPEMLDRLVDFELAADAMMATTPVTALCALDRGRVGRRWRHVSALHRLQHSPDRHPTFWFGRSGPSLTLVGEVDVSSIDDLDQLLDHLQLTSRGSLTFELPDLTFIDVAGTRRLAAFQRSMAASGRTVLFRRLSPAARRTFRAFALVDDGEVR